MKGKEGEAVSLVRAARKAAETAIKYGKIDSLPPSEPKIHRCERGLFRWTYQEPTKDDPNGYVTIECDSWKILHAILQLGWREDQTGDGFIIATFPEDTLKKRVTDFMNLKIG